MTRPLCTFHEAAATACLAKNGHHPDSDTADQLRADLARACTPWPGGWCPQPNNDQETPA